MKAASLHSPREATAGAPPADATRVSADHAPWPVALLGVAFENVTVTHAVDRIAAMVSTRATRRVEVATAARLLDAQSNARLFECLADADLVLCDSVTLVWASRWLGNPLAQRIRTPELVRELGRAAETRGWRVFLASDTAPALAALRTNLRGAAPGVHVAGAYAPARAAAFDETEAARQIRRANPDLVLSQTTTPGQETWLATNQRTLAVPVCVQLAGATAAPATGLACSHFIRPPPRGFCQRLRNGFCVARQLWRQRPIRSSAAAKGDGPARGRRTDNWVELDAGENLTRAAFDCQPDAWQFDQTRPAHCTLDVSRVRRIDATGIAVLHRYRAACRRGGRHFVLIAPSPAVRDALLESRLLRRFEIAATVRDARWFAPLTPTVAIPGLTRSLAWCGEIIAANANDVWRMTTHYARTFVAHGASLVIVDLARVRFIDSAGAAMMVRLKRWSRERRTEFLFTHPPAAVFNVLRLVSADLLVLEGGQ